MPTYSETDFWTTDRNILLLNLWPSDYSINYIYNFTVSWYMVNWLHFNSSNPSFFFLAAPLLPRGNPPFGFPRSRRVSAIGGFCSPPLDKLITVGEYIVQPLAINNPGEGSWFPPNIHIYETSYKWPSFSSTSQYIYILLLSLNTYININTNI